ncbi:MAG: protease HtpX [Gammaproteobacteria bacterium]|nr:protease HtpX [Gammaproteobacteria bacterium]MBU1553366.1 protease HtpX [Gammaproteobacteria bacterium]MBU2068859.1 protease HtpX [Gammaproteobacteria bacterium]MBU2184978.1 protease HtpX [Gammaproteobacteria bacterium]MBU2205656.1 protease HtpX [Gammaproteobacteria bacterium]
MKRVFLFLATNLAVILVLSIVLNIVFSFLGVDRSSIGGLLVFAAVFGFGGSFISLAMSKWMAKRSTGAVVIEQPRNATEQWLMATVARQAKAAGIGMPEVAVYDSPEMNAFATGMNRNDALVAVSTGLLRNMREDEVEAVLAHEVSHIANGDMVTLTLIQGVVNTFVIFLARLVAGMLNNNGNNNQGGGLAYFATVIVLEMVFGVLASIIVMWFSRQREYRADAGAAKLEGGPGKMIAALERLKYNHESRLEGSMMAFGIAGGAKKSELFLSHPPLEKRIAALRSQQF